MAGPRRSLAVPPSGQAPPEVPAPRSHSAAHRRSRGVLRALTGTWEGRAVVGGAAVKGAVWLLEAALGAAPESAHRDRHHRLGRDRGGRDLVLRSRDRHRQAPAAVAGAAQAGHFVHLHRLHSRGADCRVLPAERHAAVLELQLVSVADAAARVERPCRLVRRGHRARGPTRQRPARPAGSCRVVNRRLPASRRRPPSPSCRRSAVCVEPEGRSATARRTRRRGSKHRGRGRMWSRRVKCRRGSAATASKV